MDKNTALTEEKEKVKKNRMAQSNVWKWSTLVLFLILLINLYIVGFPSLKGDINKEMAGERAVAFINENLLVGFATATISSIEEINDLYFLDINLTSSLSGESQNATLYVTKDGNLLFPSAIDISDFEYTSPTEETPEDLSFIAAEDPIIGNPNATLTIVEYGDFECPFCGETYWTLELIFEEYPNEVKIVYKNFPLTSIHSFAQKAAEAAECANIQGEFTAYYNLLFQNQDALDIDDLKNYARDLGLDTEAFNSCLDSGAMEEEVARDTSDGAKEGVTGTPTFFIGEQRIEGNKKFAEFQAIIEEELLKMKETPKEQTNTSI